MRQWWVTIRTWSIKQEYRSIRYLRKTYKSIRCRAPPAVLLNLMILTNQSPRVVNQSYSIVGRWRLTMRCVLDIRLSFYSFTIHYTTSKMIFFLVVRRHCSRRCSRESLQPSLTTNFIVNKSDMIIEFSIIWGCALSLLCYGFPTRARV